MNAKDTNAEATAIRKAALRSLVRLYIDLLETSPDPNKWRTSLVADVAYKLESAYLALSGGQSIALAATRTIKETK